MTGIALTRVFNAYGSCHWCGDYDEPEGMALIVLDDGREWYECSRCLSDIADSDLSDRGGTGRGRRDRPPAHRSRRRRDAQSISRDRAPLDARRRPSPVRLPSGQVRYRAEELNAWLGARSTPRRDVAVLTAVPSINEEDR